MTREEFLDLEVGDEVVIDGTVDGGDFDNCPAVVVEIDRDYDYEDECNILFEVRRNGELIAWWIEYYDADSVFFRTGNRRKISGLTQFLERTTG